MADPRFFQRAGPFTLARLAEISGATLSEGADPALEMTDVAPLDDAGPTDLSFLNNRKYVESFRGSGAGAAFVHPDQVADAPDGMALLIGPTPYHAYARAAQAFYPDDVGEGRVDPSAVIHETASIGPGCVVDPGAVISAHAKLGARCRVGAGAVIREGVEIGDDCRIGDHVTLSHCLIGSRVEILPGARVGQKGFGFAMDPSGHVPVPQLGRVVVGDGVSIGANACIDRGAGPDTVIGDGTIIDNLVQIAHNVQVGPLCVIIAQVGISGSSRLEAGVVLAGQAGVTGHITIGAGAQIGAQSGILKDVAPGEKMFGSPAVTLGERMRHLAILKRLARKKG